MKKFIQMMWKEISSINENNRKKKKRDKKYRKIDSVVKPKSSEELLNKKRLDHYIELQKSLPFYDQKIVHKGSIVRQQNLIRKAKKKIHKSKLSR
ncbi:hypothetical protein [uncultured Aquimarina sp.]|uniref:hypothetical protein n=1 Tax=uncultured Aquimarina sp. TaxID=575652 RepID=UPI0026132BA7|nr:hypothetical protein [uncultured Aquimarina sp.]